MDMKKYFKFIEKHEPKFRRLKDGKIEMFTVVTQHIVADNVGELLDRGIENDLKYNGKSPYAYLIDCVESNIDAIPFDEILTR